jgi:squalene-hopene/tetraprenyl-beta-curcumene cyclase
MSASLLKNINKRVRLWNEVEPFYSDNGYDSGKAAESRGTEAVLNALILARYDAQNGHLEDSTRSAFNNMWALQQAGGSGQGAWSWLQFGMEPWEAKDSQYYGAALAAIAVGTAPEYHRLTPEIQRAEAVVVSLAERLELALARSYAAASRLDTSERAK